MTLDDSYREMCLEVEALRAERDRLLDELAEANARRGDLRTALEWANEERDEARAEIAGLPAWQKGCEQALGDLADAEEAIARLYTERDEARAEVESLTDERDELLVRVADQGAELRATREVYNDARAELTRERIGIRPVDEVRCDAYRRGAEAMRDECIGAACGFFMGTQGFCNGDEDALEEVLEALPIPEEP